jgi:raw
MQIFLGGTAGNSTWRKDIAIPMLEEAGVTYFNPQLGVGEWTPAHQALEAKEKETAAVWLFVITGESRGVASLVEAAYRIGKGGGIALAVMDVGEDALIDGQEISKAERKDLNRGRAYLREVAAQNGVPVFEDISAATQYAVGLVKNNR